MKVEIKNYKRFNGHDGQGFDATLYIDGKRSAIISDDGWGGETMWHVIDGRDSAIKKLEEACKKLPPMKFQGHELGMNADLWIEENLLQFADMKKTCRSKITIFEDGEYFTLGNGYKSKNRAYIIDAIKAKYPKAILINGMKLEATI